MARELKWNPQQTYQVELADEWAGQRRLGCHQKELKSEEIIQSNTVLKGVISFKILYRWIYDGTIWLGNLSGLR